MEGGSNIFLYSTPSIYATAKGWSAFPAIDGSFRWNGLTVGKLTPKSQPAHNPSGGGPRT